MKGYNIICDAAALAGVSPESKILKSQGLSFLNIVICEMGFLPIKSLGAPHGLPIGTRHTAVMGTAMLIASAVGDAEGRAALSEGYNLALAKNKGRVDRIVRKAFRGDDDEI